MTPLFVWSCTTSAASAISSHPRGAAIGASERALRPDSDWSGLEVNSPCRAAATRSPAGTRPSASPTQHQQEVAQASKSQSTLSPSSIYIYLFISNKAVKEKNTILSTRMDANRGKVALQPKRAPSVRVKSYKFTTDIK